MVTSSTVVLVLKLSVNGLHSSNGLVLVTKVSVLLLTDRTVDARTSLMAVQKWKLVTISTGTKKVRFTAGRRLLHQKRRTISRSIKEF
jgi:hypothetical protein